MVETLSQELRREHPLRIPERLQLPQLLDFSLSPKSPLDVIAPPVIRKQ